MVRVTSMSLCAPAMPSIMIATESSTRFITGDCLSGLCNIARPALILSVGGWDGGAKVTESFALPVATPVDNGAYKGRLSMRARSFFPILCLVLFAASPAMAAGSRAGSVPRNPGDDAMMSFNDGVSARDRAWKLEKELATAKDAAAKAKLEAKFLKAYQGAIRSQRKRGAVQPVPLPGLRGSATRCARRATIRRRWRLTIRRCRSRRAMPRRSRIARRRTRG